ncbi:MAG: HD domain-containing protein [Desulfovibrio sp.]|nr:HD domain-containing protein [Desulfovibrio sp.]
MAQATSPNIGEAYYQLSPEILESFPKFRPPVDLYALDENIAVLSIFSRKGNRLTNEQVQKAAELCAQGDLFVCRSDQHIYIHHMMKQLDLILQDENLTEAECSEICLRALTMRYAEYHEQPVPELLDKLYRDVMVFTEYLWQDQYRINTFFRRLFRKQTPAKHAINSMVTGLWLRRQIPPEQERKDFDRTAAALILHDVGMCKVPPFILSKKTALKQDEKEKVLQHPITSVKLMRKSDLVFNELIRACFEHHERLDGSGYPQKLSGSQISPMGRLTAVADSFSAMICDRPYAKGKAPIEAAKELAEDPRYDATLTGILKMGFASGKIGNPIDADKLLEDEK